jgi:uncharacterized protein (TIGR02452 family)
MKFRLEVQHNTIDIFKNTLHYVYKSTQKSIQLDSMSLRSEIIKSKFYEDGTIISRPLIPHKQQNPKIQIVNGDCLNHALRLKGEGYNPIVLNMANAEVPGGGYLHGAGAQEENLFRRTNLFQYHKYKEEQRYPIPLFGGIYCPNSTVIKASEQEGYEFLEEPEKMSFVVNILLVKEFSF